MKHVIFIGGTSYSGSTFLDMILANSPKGFSCGEVDAIFWPYRKKHVRFECGCGDHNCRIWHDIKKSGVRNLYLNIFDKHPEVEFIVDSSKNPAWIQNQVRDLNRCGIKVKNVLIWKTPEEFLHSRIKRNEKNGWRRAWINYHRLYFYMVKDWDAVRYSELVRSRGVLGRLCDKLEIPYFEGKERFWEKTHHTLFGNTSAKIHLYDRTSANYQECESVLDSRLVGLYDHRQKSHLYKKIYYETPDPCVQQEITKITKDHQVLMKIIRKLRQRDIMALQSTDLSGEHNSARDEDRAARVLKLIHTVKRPIRSLYIKLYEKIIKL